MVRNDECLFCGEKDSIDDTFLNCQFLKIFVNKLIAHCRNMRALGRVCYID